MSQAAPLSRFHPAAMLATAFGIGRLPAAPGTWAALAALPIGWLIVRAAGPWLLLASAAALFAAGLWAGGRYAQARGIADPGSVVIDEVVGQWIALMWVPVHPATYVTAFLLFRLFDILKPWPIGWIDRRLAGGTGIMADDAVAGLFALAVLQAALTAWGVLTP